MIQKEDGGRPQRLEQLRLPLDEPRRTASEQVAYNLKVSGERKQFDSGMIRDVDADKIRYDLAFDGPMFERYAQHLTNGANKYAARNWMKANSKEELNRFKESAIRHFIQYIRGDTDEDHFSAIIFNLNGIEYVREKLNEGA